MRVPLVVVLNKIDRVEKTALLPRMAAIGGPRRRRRHRAGLGRHRRERRGASRTCSSAHLPEGPALYPDDFLTDQPERFFVAELVREQVLRHTHAELPFSTAVVVDAFEEPEQEGGLLRLHCTILVERASQKPILLGKGGAMIKAIGTAARLELERFFAAKVFLDLHVKVRADWRDDDRTLSDLGLPDGPKRSARPSAPLISRCRVRKSPCYP